MIAAAPPTVSAPFRDRPLRLLDALLCRFGRCRRCAVYETVDGIGGRCERCGRVHGWVTSAELQAVADVPAGYWPHIRALMTSAPAVVDVDVDEGPVL